MSKPTTITSSTTLSVVTSSVTSSSSEPSVVGYSFYTYYNSQSEYMNDKITTIISSTTLSVATSSVTLSSSEPSVVGYSFYTYYNSQSEYINDKITTITSSTTLSVATSSVTSSSSEPSVVPTSSSALTLIIALLASFIGGIMCVLLIVIPIIILLACKARKNRGVNDEQKDNAFEFGINTTYGRGGGGGERNLILGLNRAYDVKGELKLKLYMRN